MSIWVVCRNLKCLTIEDAISRPFSDASSHYLGIDRRNVNFLKKMDKCNHI